MFSLAQAVVTKYRDLGGLRTTEIYLRNPGGWKAEVRLL